MAWLANGSNRLNVSQSGNTIFRDARIAEIVVVGNFKKVSLMEVGIEEKALCRIQCFVFRISRCDIEPDIEVDRCLTYHPQWYSIGCYVS